MYNVGPNFKDGCPLVREICHFYFIIAVACFFCYKAVKI